MLMVQARAGIPQRCWRCCSRRPQCLTCQTRAPVLIRHRQGLAPARPIRERHSASTGAHQAHMLGQMALLSGSSKGKAVHWSCAQRTFCRASMARPASCPQQQRRLPLLARDMALDLVRVALRRARRLRQALLRRQVKRSSRHQAQQVRMQEQELGAPPLGNPRATGAACRGSSFQVGSPPETRCPLRSRWQRRRCACAEPRQPKAAMMGRPLLTLPAHSPAR